MTNIGTGYVHGYAQKETERLAAQAWSVAELLHDDVRYGADDLVLEVGCGTGAQTVTLARNNPRTRIIAFDRSKRSLDKARRRLASAKAANVELHQADLFELPFAEQSFDHVFVCFVLEHLAKPKEALAVLQRFLKPGGRIVVFEGDHGSTYFHPDSELASRAIGCQVELQRRGGGNALIGRQLYPLLREAGFVGVHVAPKTIYVDGSRPDLIDSFTLRTFTAMIEGVREKAIKAKLMRSDSFDRGIADLERTAAEDGVFCYTFFKGTASRQTPL
jgi:SAM-dependent methyltransferase